MSSQMFKEIYKCIQRGVGEAYLPPTKKFLYKYWQVRTLVYLWMFATWILIGSFNVFTLIINAINEEGLCRNILCDFSRRWLALINREFEQQMSTGSELNPFPFQCHLMLPKLYSTTTTRNFIFAGKTINYKYRLHTNKYSQLSFFS